MKWLRYRFCWQKSNGRSQEKAIELFQLLSQEGLLQFPQHEILNNSTPFQFQIEFP
jgi:hypothetical protein